MPVLRVVFMGTPAFATPTLRRLAAESDYEIVGVVTQPDAPAGRGRDLLMSPVKQLAIDLGLPVLQPLRIRHPEAVAALQALRPDVQIVAAFGQLLPRSVLDIPPLATLNVHASLLPRWRGASPVTAAILAGDTSSGITIMRLDEGMDTGDILAQASLRIDGEATTGSLTLQLAELGADLLAEALPRWASSQITPRAQDDRLATMCRPVQKESGRIDWRQPAVSIERAVRAYSPWPGSYTTWNGKRVKVVAATAWPSSERGVPGTVTSAEAGPAVVTGEGLLVLQKIQMEGKRVLPAGDFARGQRDLIGSLLV